MPERTPAFDFKGLKPDVPVKFTLLKESFSGRKDGADYDWHAYPCAYAGNEVMVFTPNERVHTVLQLLKVLPKTNFIITKGSDVNLDTGKPFIFYTIQYGDEIMDTKDTEPTSAPKPEAGPLADTLLIKEPRDQDILQTFTRFYGNIMTLKIDNIASHVDWEKLSDPEKLQTLWELDKSTSANVSTILINQQKNGGR